MSSFSYRENIPLAQANTVILPVPLEETTSFNKGTRLGPEAILQSSLELEYFDEELLFNIHDYAMIHTADSLYKYQEEELEDFHKRLFQSVYHLHQTEFLVCLGGEHSISASIIPARFQSLLNHNKIAGNFRRCTVVVIDAHADLRDSYEGSKLSHASISKRIADIDYPLVQIGIRVISQEEFQVALEKNTITQFFSHQLQSSDHYSIMLKQLMKLTGPVYISVDMDALDLSIAPSVGNPVPGGLSWWQLLDILRTLLLTSKCQVIGADIVETIPDFPQQRTQYTAAQILFKMIAYYTYKHFK